MSYSTEFVWYATGLMHRVRNGTKERVPAAMLQSSMHNPTASFWCDVLSEFGNPVRRFDTGLQDYNDAKRLVEMLCRMGEL